MLVEAYATDPHPEGEEGLWRPDYVTRAGDEGTGLEGKD